MPTTAPSIKVQRSRQWLHLFRKWEAHYMRAGVSVHRVTGLARAKADRGRIPPAK